MNFSTADKVASVIDTMRNAENQRAPDRAILNGFYNGDAPWTEKEAEDNGILINFNDKQGANLLHQGRNQLENAFGKTGTFIKVTVPDAPADEQLDIGVKITRYMNRMMSRSRSFYYTQDCVWGGVLLHGVGAKVWWDDMSWLSSFIGIQDILLPTDTDLTMDNCRYIALRRPIKPGSLFKKTIAKGKDMDKGWNLPAVKKLLDTYSHLNTNAGNYNWSNNPEQMTELYKQNRSYYDADAAPIIWLWDFYHLEEENKDPNLNGWYRKIMLDSDCVPTSLGNEAVRFIYEKKKSFAQKLDNIIHFQFGDGNNVPPFKYHSIRSLGWLVFDLLWIMNRLNCQFTQHVFEQMMLLFRVQDPTDLDRLQKLILQGIVGIIPEGLNMVTAQERYQVDSGLVQGLLANLKQRVGESSSQYTQNIDNGTQKERTKYEVQAILAQASALMASMIGRAYRQEHFSALEIARRFTIKNSTDFDVKKFRNLCLNDDVDAKWLDSDRWEVEIPQVMGGGNRMLELAEATELMERAESFDPEAQQEIKHDFVLAVTNNPKKAARLAPLNAAPKVSDSAHDAQVSFGTLMLGVEMQPQEGINHADQIETLLGMMQKRIGVINMTGGVGKPEDVIGLQTVAKYIASHIQIIAQNPKEKARVKAYSDALSKMMNEVRAFAQRQAEAAKKNGNQMDPEVMAKIQGDIQELQVKLKGKEATAQQQLRHKELKFQQGQRHKEAQAGLDLNVKTGTALADTHIKAASAAAQPPKNPTSE